MLQHREADLHATETYPGTQAVARAIAVLKAFSDGQPEWSLTDLAQATGLNKTTAFRILAALEAENLVARNSLSGGYRLGVGTDCLGRHCHAFEPPARNEPARAGGVGTGVRCVGNP